MSGLETTLRGALLEGAQQLEGLRCRYGACSRLRLFLTAVLGAGSLADEVTAPLGRCGPHAESSRTRSKSSRGVHTSIAPTLVGRRCMTSPSTRPSESCEVFFGVQVAYLSVRYGVEVEDGLAAILPVTDED